jgi:hypothetical protein
MTKPLRGFVLKFRGKARLKQTVSALNAPRDGLEACSPKSHETSCWWSLAKRRVTKPLRGFVLKFRGRARFGLAAYGLNTALDGYEACGPKSHETSCRGERRGVGRKQGGKERLFHIILLK